MIFLVVCEGGFVFVALFDVSGCCSSGAGQLHAEKGMRSVVGMLVQLP